MFRINFKLKKMWNNSSILVLFLCGIFFFYSCASSPIPGIEAQEKEKTSSSAAQRARDAANKGFIDETGEGIGYAGVPESMPGRSEQLDEPELIVTQNINTSKKQPSWVSNSQAAYPSSRYLSAVGSGKSTSEAENAAIAAIARIIKQNVASTLVTTEKDSVSSSGASNYQSTIDEIIETHSVVDALVGVKIGEFWWDTKDNVFAVAYVEKQEATQYYSKKISDNEAVIVEKMALAKKNEGDFSSFTLVLQALNLAEEVDQYLDILHAMDTNAARNKILQYGSSIAVKEFSYTVAQKISVDISVDGDTDGRVGFALATMLAKYGFKTKIGLSNSAYLLDSAMSLVDVPAERNYYVRFIFSANLMEKRSGKNVLPFSINKREGHINAEGAKERAIQSLVKTIETEYASFFIDFLQE